MTGSYLAGDFDGSGATSKAHASREAGDHRREREPGMTVSLGARRHGLAPNQLFTWRRLAEQGAPASSPESQAS